MMLYSLDAAYLPGERRDFERSADLLDRFVDLLNAECSLQADLLVGRKNNGDSRLLFQVTLDTDAQPTIAAFLVALAASTGATLTTD